MKTEEIQSRLNLSLPEPSPKKNEHPFVVAMVVRDLEERMAFGMAKYGTPLQPFNGRNSLKDAYQEVLDLAIYIRQRLMEEELNGQGRLFHGDGPARVNEE